jgi:vitamin B12 transporter
MLRLNQSSLISLMLLATPIAAQAQSTTDIPNLRDLPPTLTQAQALMPSAVAQTTAPAAAAAAAEEIVIIERDATPPPTATPTYEIDRAEIDKQGAGSLSETLKGLPGFAINDTGFAADIHTGTTYRGSSLNQSVFMLNGRSINTNVNTYHGNVDLNSLPVEAIEKVEVSSGSSATLYGSEAFGGVIDITTKPGGGLTKFTGGLLFGSYGQQTYRGGLGGALGDLDYSLGYERSKSDSDYRVPIGAANRGADGRLTNADTDTSSYYGRLAWKLNPQNTLSLDGTKITSRKGLIYFGFPLQRDRLDHDAFNTGLKLRSEFAKGSVLNTTLSFNKDYFHTYGPTANVFFRQGRLDSSGVSLRLDHEWALSDRFNLRWGADLKNANLRAETESTNPAVRRFNEDIKASRFTPALFALGKFDLNDTLKAELGLRQNFSTDFGSSLNPSLGLNWSPTQTIGLRGSWVSVKRLPGLDQQFAYDTVHNWFPNENLNAERGSSWTAGVDLNRGGAFSGQLTYFGSTLRDRIAIQPSPLNGRTVSQWQNIGKVNTNGLELALQYQLSPQWRTFFNYTYTDARIATGADRGWQLSQIPFSVGQLGLGYSNQGWQVNLYTNYFSGARRTFFLSPTNNAREFSPSWLNVDLNLRVPVSRGLGLMVYLENLGGKSYEKVNRIYQPGTTFRIGLSSEF